MSTATLIVILLVQTLIISLVVIACAKHLKAVILKKVAIIVQQSLNQPRAIDLQIFVNSLPKVGSTTIYRMLKAAFPGAVIEHSHFISNESQLAAARDLEGLKPGTLKTSLTKIIPRAIAAQFTLDKQLEAPPEKACANTYFICGIREPLSWALSCIFELVRTDMLPSKYSEPAEARRIIMDWFDGQPPLQWLPEPGEWMGREIDRFLSIDSSVHTSFDPAKGYLITNTKRGKLLLVRLESFNQCLPQALSELTSAPANLFNISQANSTAEKNIGSKYVEVVKNLRFPKHFLDKVYQSWYAKTFYSATERGSFTTRWAE